MEGVTVPTEVQIGEEKVLPPPQETGFSGKWNDVAKDLALIQKESEMQTDVSPVEVEQPKEPAQPEQAQAAAIPATIPPAIPEEKAKENEPTKLDIPDKFRAQDGTLDQERILKSYKEAERELKRKQNAAQVQPTQAQSATPEPDSFAARLEQDVKTHGLGPVLERLFYAAKAVGTNEVLENVRDIRESVNEARMVEQLKAIAERDPWVFSPEGFETLKKTRADHPHLNASPEPWKDAYLLHLGLQSVKSKNPAAQVITPTPKVVTAPPGPVAAAGRVSTPQIRLDTKEDIIKHLDGLTKEQQSEFWKKAGFKW